MTPHDSKQRARLDFEIQLCKQYLISIKHLTNLTHIILKFFSNSKTLKPSILSNSEARAEQSPRYFRGKTITVAIQKQVLPASVL
jgi:hypothetical protein